MERLGKQHFKADMLNKYGTDLTKMAQEVKPDFSFSHVLAEPVTSELATITLTLASLNGILQGKLDQVVGRRKQIERVTQILRKRRKNNPCLVGDPGVGKTVIVEGLAANIVKGTVPSKLEGKKVVLQLVYQKSSHLILIINNSTPVIRTCTPQIVMCSLDFCFGYGASSCWHQISRRF